MDINRIAANRIGDGKLPNEYFVYQYDTEHTQTIDEDGYCRINPITENAKGEIIGRYRTYKEALAAIDREAYLPHVFIEDRLSGLIFERMCVVCPCCGKRDCLDFEDYGFTKEKIEKSGSKFI